MLLNPFIETEPAYSENSTGILLIDPKIGTESVPLLLYIKDVLESVGWTKVDQAPSFAHGETIRVFMPTAVPIIPPRVLVEMTDACTSLLFPQWIQWTIEGKAYVAYNPYVYLAPPDCPDRFWYPAGETPEATAATLAAKMTATSNYLVLYTGNRHDPNMPFMNDFMQFSLTAKPPMTFESDWMNLGPAGYSAHGYYLMKSPDTPSGGNMTAKLQTGPVTIFGHDTTGSYGELVPVITVAGSNGGTYSQPIFPDGEYWMQASRYQFVIWTDRVGRRGTMMLASLPKMSASHVTDADSIVCVGSESFANWGLTTFFQQLVDQLHWSESIASGYGNVLVETGYRTQATSNKWRTPTMMLRALRGAGLGTISETPFVQPAYLLASENPNQDVGDTIAGRLWDMILTTTAGSGPTGQGVVMYDGRKWRRLSANTVSGDLTASMFVLG